MEFQAAPPVWRDCFSWRGSQKRWFGYCNKDRDGGDLVKREISFFLPCSTRMGSWASGGSSQCQGLRIFLSYSSTFLGTCLCLPVQKTCPSSGHHIHATASRTRRGDGTGWPMLFGGPNWKLHKSPFSPIPFSRTLWKSVPSYKRVWETESSAE